MKKAIIFITLLIYATGSAQILEPVKWTTSVTKISNTEYELVAMATIEKNWHLYSQTVPDDGPIPTNFTFEGSGNYLKKGNTTEEKGHTIDDPIFDMKITYFENKASFKQRIKLKEKVPFKVNATVEFMVCDDSRCLPPTEVDLVFNIK
ncbi:Disulfide bond corrector protein DsbC [Mariniflexile rhizosphaerae]|uniref:protein-disulfide reductase DsbD domain-containing protein n=1 Tax=unclassified Mariniflexile TaxID=2643887 RepID=UPI000CA7D5DE|nr:protein-disulfide reductase DsbD domain-containing protein [Mariniflexile sp. TRM1-10]AXP82180.1 Disulfide bond corrector protein DsbC [Mariniflexile sp. TRM1-10]PLB19258.1 MAG: Cytochrome c biogenesis protein, transmembrane region [Flavobacteriaceae bacterium FS1-H7996/R]